MCAPLAIAAVTAGVDIASEGAGAKAQDISAQHAWGAAQRDLMNKYNATQAREQQEMQRTQLQIFQAQKEGASLSSRIRAQAAAGSVAGATVREREQQPGINVTDFASTAKINLANELRQNQADAASFSAQAQSIINENQPESGVALALKVGSTVAGAASKIPLPSGGSGSDLSDVQTPDLTEAFANLDKAIG